MNTAKDILTILNKMEEQIVGMEVINKNLSDLTVTDIANFSTEDRTNTLAELENLVENKSALEHAIKLYGGDNLLERLGYGDVYDRYIKVIDATIIILSYLTALWRPKVS